MKTTSFLSFALSVLAACFAFGPTEALAQVERFRVPADSAPWQGASSPLVTIVQFTEFQCPFCSRVRPTIEQVLRQYPDDVRIVFRHNPLPFHNRARPAANVAVEVYRQGGNAAVWKFHDLAFENQRDLSDDNLVGFAVAAGADARRARRVLSANTHDARIQKDMDLAQQVGARGTPHFFINGRKLAGAQPFSKFEEIIEHERRSARRLIRRGIARSDLYDQFMQTAVSQPTPAPAPRPATPPATQNYEIPVPGDAPSTGSPNAPVTIQWFADFECPFCARSVPTMERILEEYSGRVRVVWRHFPLPFHRNAMPAHEAALEVYKQLGEAAFWEYHKTLYSNRRQLQPDDLLRYAQQIQGRRRINARQFRQALTRQTHRPRVQQDMDAIERAGARIGTPAFFVNGRLLQGAQPFEAFKPVIDEAIRQSATRPATRVNRGNRTRGRRVR